MTADDLRAVLMALYNVQRTDLSEVDEGEWKRFRSNPSVFYARASFQQQAAIWREVAKRIPGATGEFPDGKINDDDEGELRLAVSHDAKGQVRVDFGKPVGWVVFPRPHVLEFCKVLLRHAGVNVP